MDALRRVHPARYVRKNFPSMKTVIPFSLSSQGTHPSFLLRLTPTKSQIPKSTQADSSRDGSWAPPSTCSTGSRATRRPIPTRTNPSTPTPPSKEGAFLLIIARAIRVMTSRVFCSLQARAPTSSRRTSHSAQIRGVLPPRPARSAQAAFADDRHHRLVGHAGPAGAFILMCFVWAIRLTSRVFCVQVTHVSDGVHSTTTKAFATACIVLFAALVRLFSTLILVWAIKWIDGVFCYHIHRCTRWA